MAFTYNKLRGRIVERFGKQETFAEAMGWSQVTLSKHMTNGTAWRQMDIVKACELLEIPTNEIHDYFFDTEVES